MKLIKVKITPKSSFVTFPKGDTIFGHFAYQTFLEQEQKLKNYLIEKPKIIFSDFLPDGYLPKPTLMLKCFGIQEEEKKDFRLKEWISIESLQSGNLEKCEDINFFKKKINIRNALNRLTFTTDKSGAFAPYDTNEITFLYQPVLYIQYDELSFTQEYILEILNKIGKIGFGKKGSIGKGSFSAKIDEKFNGFKKVQSDYYLTLSPTFLHEQKETIALAYYNLFNRFGKYHSTSTPFKKPILMADSGTVLKLIEKLSYIGKAINNGIDKSKPSFVQGYSITVPFILDETCLGEKK